ncbi:lipoprotein N-acyltransferase Lnb domain-containing protein [Chitinimonas sp. BJB300]|uniref:lipoprotein N-acyltransferase Lnb domain-containing protein n=1 Tax=Chitinimonas sp. BJB300 TaxID=1559339 RepID=UPI0013043FED|nr:DUF4105 domain-containing protein [Chitinimonas sp. BJB300]
MFWKSGLLAAFFSSLIWLSFPALARGEDTVVQRLQTNAITLHLDQDPTWLALLHISGGKTRIFDKSFVLSHPNFSAKQELLQTLALLYDPNVENTGSQCRFPARYTWLKQKLNAPNLPLESCEALQHFRKRAPVDSVAVVFASENLTQPSSMMGHLLLKIAGMNEEQIPVEHAISFFTDTGTFNLPKLFYDSLVIGKRGYYTLSPYQEKTERYVLGEQRNIWEYGLNLSPEVRNLVQLHLYELKQTELTYFFDSYNCATLVNFILAVAAPSLREPKGWWLTPNDVIKSVSEQGLVQQTTVRASSRWIVRMLNENMPSDRTALVRHAVEQREVNSFTESEIVVPSFFDLELANAYNNYLFEQSQMPRQDWLSYANKLDKVKHRLFPGQTLDASEYKKPTATPQDAQVYAGFLYGKHARILKFGILPTSHQIEDDNRQYFSENELRLFELNLSYDIDRRRIKLDELTIYAVQSLIPYDTFTKGWSGRFRLGLLPQYNQQLESKAVPIATGGLGLTTRINRDIDVYGLLSVGAGYANQAFYGYLNPEIGFIAREVHGMKSLISYTQNHNQRNSGERFDEWAFQQYFPMGKNHAASVKYIERKGTSLIKREAELRLKYYF